MKFDSIIRSRDSGGSLLFFDWITLKALKLISKFEKCSFGWKKLFGRLLKDRTVE